MNYNSLMNKPTINNKELIGNNKASDIGGLSEEEMEQLLTTDLTPYYTKAQIDDLFSRSYVYREKSGSIVTFDCPATPQNIPEVTAEIVAVQSGSGDPSPTNVRPISGWSAVNVVKCGKNLVFKKLANTSITNDGTIVASSFDMWVAKVKKDITYTITSNELFVGGFFTDEPVLNSITYNNQRIADKPRTFVAPIDGYVTFRSESEYSTAQCEIGSQSTDYVPYNPDSTAYTIDLDGTRYGCTLDVVSGVLTVDKGYIASYNGETLPSTWISDRDVYAEGTTPTIGAEVVYELATPQTIQLTPTAVNSLEGTNNIWADSGDITVKALDKIIQE